MKKLRFKGKKVVITGASTGIGWAMAREFAQRGALLVLGGLPSEEALLEKRIAEIENGYGGTAWAVAVDLLAPGGPERFHEQAVKAAGEDIFALVNNAGTVAYGRFPETPFEGHRQTLMLNLYVPMRLMHLFLPAMLEREKGAILNTSSVSALQPTPFQSAYGASKAGLQSLSQAVNAELMGTGVTVCTVNPPYINTRLLETPGYPRDLRFYAISGKKSPEWLASRAVRAFEEGKAVYVPGAGAKFIHVFLNRITPRSAQDRVSRFFMQGWKSKQE